jgi:hypothetical protein
MAEEAARVKAEACCDAIRHAADRTAGGPPPAGGRQHQAEQLKAQAEAEADNIRGRAWNAIRLATKELER